MRGTVKWFNGSKGYGFIIPSNGGADVFVHYTAIEGGGHKTLPDGAVVEFGMTTDKGRTKATNVRVVA